MESALDMSYIGLIYPRTWGTYRVPNSNSLTFLGKHTFPAPNREEFTTYIDAGIKECYDQYPHQNEWSHFKNYSSS